MITWMQRHRKYLNITLWISVGAFVAAGPMFAIGSASFSGGGADAVAKVGNVEVTIHQMNSAYRQLFSRYNQMFQGKFDEAQAKAFGLQKQALDQLIDEALLLNLAQSFKLEVMDSEVSKNIATTDAFFKDAKFHKDTYKKVLKQARLNITEYETDVRRSLLIQKLMGLLTAQALPLEEEAIATALYINDKISYKVLDKADIKITANAEHVKAYWENNKFSYMTEPSFALEFIEQKNVNGTYSEEDIKIAYEENKHDFTNDKGELKTFEEAKDLAKAVLNKKANNKEALRTYIAYKKDKLNETQIKQSITITQATNPYTAEVFEKISRLTTEKPHLKPQFVNDKFIMIKLVESKASEVQTYEQAQASAKADYLEEETNKQFTQLAKSSADSFKGKKTGFLTRESIKKLAPLTEFEAAEFLEALFTQNTKRGFIPLKEGKIVLFNILEQKLLKKDNDTQKQNALRLKTSLLNDGLLKKLGAQFPVTSYLEGK